jgi:prepilin-type processing-associated H-X9-DG protein
MARMLPILMSGTCFLYQKHGKFNYLFLDWHENVSLFLSEYAWKTLPQEENITTRK